MSALMTVLNTMRGIARHPLNSEKPARALARFVRWQIASRLVPGPVIVPFINEAVLAAAPGMTGATGNIYNGLYSFEEMGFLLHALRRGDLFVDVGANVGAYTVLAGAAVGANCISIEPLPSTFADLCRNIRLNGIESLCETRNEGAGGEDGSLLFTNDEGAMNHVVTGNGGVGANTTSVPVRTLDGVLGERSPAILKIDAEGYETEVMRGASRLLVNPSVMAILVQLNGRGKLYGYDEDAIHRKILACGFRPHRYDPFTRNLVEAPGKSARRYTLYCRDADRVNRLVSTAPKYRVRDHEL